MEDNTSDSQPHLHDSQPHQIPVVTPISQIPSNSSKIPIRPQKMRKLSSDVSFDSTDDKDKAPLTTDADSSKALTIVHDPVATTSTKNRRRNPSQSSRDLQRIIKPLITNGEIDRALRHLRSADSLLAQLIDTHPPPTFDSNQPPFLALTKSILYQQLAFKVGSLIYNRFVAQCGGEGGVVTDTVLSLSAQQLKQIGVSARKASYLYDLSNKYKTGILSDESIVKMDDMSLFTMLSMVKGIGSWSVHMFMKKTSKMKKTSIVLKINQISTLPFVKMGVICTCSIFGE